MSKYTNCKRNIQKEIQLSRITLARICFLQLWLARNTLHICRNPNPGAEWNMLAAGQHRQNQSL